MYISNNGICDILHLVYLGWALFLPFLQTINVYAMDLIIITCFSFFASVISYIFFISPWVSLYTFANIFLNLLCYTKYKVVQCICQI